MALDTASLPRFGIEIETVGLSRLRIAQAIRNVTGGTVVESDYTPTVRMTDGRSWTVSHDGSLSGDVNGEIVSPILTYADLGTVQEIVRAVRIAGARADDSCGIHVHVDGAAFDAPAVVRLVNMVHKNERTLEKAFGVSAYRLGNYTQSIKADFIARLDAIGARPTMTALQTAWYGGGDRYGRSEPSRYNSTRYHGLNLNSFFYRGTFEFRYFNGTLHAGEVKSYVQLCLAMAQRALTVSSTQRARRIVPVGCEKWTMRLFMKTLGMVGPEFATARGHFIKRLSGSTDNPSRVSVARASRDVQAVAVPAERMTG